MTDCETCRRAELTRFDRLREDLLTVLGLNNRQHLAAIQSFGRIIAVAYGAPARSEYDRHRDEYERTGDPLELTRMLRHVKAE